MRTAARVFRFKVPAKSPAAETRPLRSEPPSRWESVLTRSLNSLHPHARIRFADPFLLRAPLGRRRSLRALGLRTPVSLMLALDPVLPGGQRCADCLSAAECAGEPPATVPCPAWCGRAMPWACACSSAWRAIPWPTGRSSWTWPCAMPIAPFSCCPRGR